MALLAGLLYLLLGSYYYMKYDPYPHHIYAIPTRVSTVKPVDKGAIPKVKPPNCNPNTIPQKTELQLTPQDQRAYITISVKSGVPCTSVSLIYSSILMLNFNINVIK